MPKNKNAFSRHRIIDQCINDKRRKYPTLENLAERCSELLDVNVSPSTIEKDIAAMKKNSPVGYNAPIIYSKQHRGYVYSEIGFSIAELNLQDEEWNALKFAAQLLYQYKSVPIFSDFKNAIERINTRFSLGLEIEDPILNQHVQFEKANAYNGMEWIDLLYDVIKKKHAINFTYNNIYKKKTSTYSLVPYLLKEHRNRWYVIGWNEERSDYLTFSIDRITALEIISIPQKKRNDFHADTFFQHATGIMEGTGKPQNIELLISDPICKLVLLEPIHHSQKIIKETQDTIHISINVLVNEELCLRLLGLGPWCSIVKPSSLKKTIHEMLLKMVNNNATGSKD